MRYHWSLIKSMVNTSNILWVNAQTYLRKKSRNGKLPRTVATSSISSQCSSLSSLLVSAGSVAHIAILTGIINMKKVTPGSSNAFVGAFICRKCQSMIKYLYSLISLSLSCTTYWSCMAVKILSNERWRAIVRERKARLYYTIHSALLRIE